MKHINQKRPWLAAAMIAMMLCLAGCTAVMLNLKDLQVAQETYRENAHYEEDGTKVEAAKKDRTILSLQGIAGSSGQKAAQEWYEFEKSYDPDNALLFANEDFIAPENYHAYNVYTQEMIEKVDEICRKYGLQLAGPLTLIQSYQTDVFFDALGLDSLHKGSAEVTYLGGYFYACGNFHMEFDMTLAHPEAKWTHPISGSIRRNGKDYFDTLTLTIDDNTRHWNYTQSDGTDVLIVKNQDRAWILCDQEDAFFCADFDITDTLGNRMSDRDMELAAEALDFSVTPQKPDLTAVKAQLEAAEQAYQLQQEALLNAAESQPWADPFAKDSYRELVSYISANPEEFIKRYGVSWQDMDGYVLMDVTGDGLEELILSRKGNLAILWTMVDGKTRGFWGSDSLFLVEGGILGQHAYRDGEHHYYYWRIGADSADVAYVGYNKYQETWEHIDYAVSRESMTITEAQAKEILASYAPMELDWLPISKLLLK